MVAVVVSVDEVSFEDVSVVADVVLEPVVSTAVVAIVGVLVTAAAW